MEPTGVKRKLAVILAADAEGWPAAIGAHIADIATQAGSSTHLPSASLPSRAACNPMNTDVIVVSCSISAELK